MLTFEYCLLIVVRLGWLLLPWPMWTTMLGLHGFYYAASTLEQSFYNIITHHWKLKCRFNLRYCLFYSEIMSNNKHDMYCFTEKVNKQFHMFSKFWKSVSRTLGYSRRLASRTLWMMVWNNWNAGDWTERRDTDKKSRWTAGIQSRRNYCRRQFCFVLIHWSLHWA